MSDGTLPLPDPAAERQMQLILRLRSLGVTDARVLAAMERVDRGAFVRGVFASRAYEDMPLPISCGQTISQPSVVGQMTQALNPQPRDKVLEVGTGSGYQAAILSLLCRRVYTIDRHRALVGHSWPAGDKGHGSHQHAKLENAGRGAKHAGGDGSLAG